MTQTRILVRPTVLSESFPRLLPPSSAWELEPIVVDHILLDRENQRVYRDGKAVHLTEKEFRLLEVLIDHPNQALTREKLLFLVWGYTVAGDTRTVDVHINQLRKKLAFQNRIRTVFRVGYCFLPG